MKQDRAVRAVLVVVLTAAATIVVVGFAALLLTINASPPPGTQPDMNGALVAVDPSELPSSDDLEKMPIDSETGMRFVVPSVALDVPLDTMSKLGDRITPPGFTAAYRIRDLGAEFGQENEGTVYIALHSIAGGGVGPGNYLIDVTENRSSVKPGSAIQVGDLNYMVTESQMIRKDELPRLKEIWANTPGRLVIVTCMQTVAGAPSTDNVLIIAELAS